MINTAVDAKENPSGTLCVLRPGYCFYFSSPPLRYTQLCCCFEVRSEAGLG